MISNLLFFKLVWLASLLGVAAGYAWLGILTLTLFITWHAATAPTARADFAIALTAMLVGVLLDSLYVSSGLIAYKGELIWSDGAPLWILALWANFALTFNGCLQWLKERRMLAAGLAMVCGPLSYYGGIRLGTATVTGNDIALYALIGLGWSVAVPLLLWLLSRYEKKLRPEEPVNALLFT